MKKTISVFGRGGRAFLCAAVLAAAGLCLASCDTGSSIGPDTEGGPYWPEEFLVGNDPADWKQKVGTEWNGAFMRFITETGPFGYSTIQYATNGTKFGPAYRLTSFTIDTENADSWVGEFTAVLDKTGEVITVTCVYDDDGIILLQSYGLEDADGNKVIHDDGEFFAPEPEE